MLLEVKPYQVHLTKRFTIVKAPALEGSCSGEPIFLRVEGQAEVTPARDYSTVSFTLSDGRKLVYYWTAPCSGCGQASVTRCMETAGQPSHFCQTCWNQLMDIRRRAKNGAPVIRWTQFEPAAADQLAEKVPAVQKSPL